MGRSYHRVVRYEVGKALSSAKRVKVSSFSPGQIAPKDRHHDLNKSLEAMSLRINAACQTQSNAFSISRKTPIVMAGWPLFSLWVRWWTMRINWSVVGVLGAEDIGYI